MSKFHKELETDFVGDIVEVEGESYARGRGGWVTLKVHDEVFSSEEAPITAQANMTPDQARKVAKALKKAAEAAEGV